MAPFFTTTEHVVTLPTNVPGFVEADAQYIVPAIDQVLNGEVDAVTAMSGIAEAVDAILLEAMNW